MALSKKDQNDAKLILRQIYYGRCSSCMYNRCSGSTPSTWCSAENNPHCFQEYNDLMHILDKNYGEPVTETGKIRKDVKKIMKEGDPDAH